MFVFGVDKIEYFLQNDDREDLIDVAVNMIENLGWSVDLDADILWTGDCYAVFLWKIV